MLPNEMGFELTALEVTQIVGHLDGIITILNGHKVIQLSDDERGDVQSVKDGRYSYVRDTFEDLAPLYPQCQVPYKVFATELRTYNYMNQMRSIADRVSMVNDVVGDHGIAAENFNYTYMLELYDIAKRAVKSNVPGADVIVQRLSPLFENQGNTVNTGGGGGG